MFKPKPRRTRGPTLMLDSSVPAPNLASEAAASNQSLAQLAGGELRQGAGPLWKFEHARIAKSETSLPEIAVDTPPERPIEQDAHGSNTANATATVKITKEHVEARSAQDQAVVEDMKTKFTASKSTPLWSRYVKIAEAEDKDVLEDWEGAIDVTLAIRPPNTALTCDIWISKAALFSAISTGFVLESSKNLKPDQGAATVLAIRELTSVVQTGLQMPSTNPLSNRELESLRGPFQPAAIDVLINCLWFLSLGLSISVSLFAMLAKRWCYGSRSRHSGTDYERAMRRQKVWDTLQKWKLELLIEQLPTVMHVALMSFFIGLVLYLSEIHRATMIITAIPVGFTILSYAALTVLPAWSPDFLMVTPFTRIMQAGTRYILQLGPQVWSKIRSHSLCLYLEKALYGIVSAKNRVIDPLKRSMFPSHSTRAQDPNFESETKSTVSLTSPKDWILTGRPLPAGITIPYPRSEEQKYPFRALLWLLRNSNDKTLINEILEYVSSFPEVVLDSFASSQELYEAAIVISEHFQRLKHDAVEWHHLNAIQFSAKCERFIFLIARPWLHHPGSASRGPLQGHILNIYHFMFVDMSAEEVEAEIQIIKDQNFYDAAPPETGFKLCRALCQSITSKEPTNGDQQDEICSTLAWMFLNTVIDAGRHGTFWPTHESWAGLNLTDDGEDSVPVASCDSTLTLSYYRHSEKRKENSLWLKIVGLSGMLNIPTHYPCEDVEPDTSSNHDYYKRIIKLLRPSLSSATHSLPIEGQDPYIGSFPVYYKNQIRLYEFDSLQYCYDALGRASAYPRFVALSSELRELRDMIPINRRSGFISSHSKSEVDVLALAPDLPINSQVGIGLV